MSKLAQPAFRLRGKIKEIDPVTGQPIEWVYQGTPEAFANFRGNDGSPMLRRRNLPQFNPRTPPQGPHRSAFRLAVYFWQEAPTEAREFYTRLGRPYRLPGFQRWMSLARKGRLPSTGTIWDTAASAWDNGATDWDMLFYTSWDSGATLWDNGATSWDSRVPTSWDSGSTVWDNGATLWDSVLRSKWDYDATTFDRGHTVFDLGR